MARPRKSGLDYFPFDVGFFEDDKIACISGEFGEKGECVAIKLLCAIYRNGYFVEWSDRLKYTLLNRMKDVSAGLLDQIVGRLVRWSFFDKALFDSAKILTSAGIQRRYFEVVKRRSTATTNLPYLLINDCENREQNGISGVDVAITGVNVAETTVNVDKNTIKKSKVNKKISLKRDEKRPDAASGAGGLSPSFVEVNDFFKAEILNGSAEDFFNYYQARNWQAGGAPISDWQALARLWSSRERTSVSAQQRSGSSHGRPSATSDLEAIKASDRRKAIEAEKAAAREAQENPERLSSAQALAAYKRRMGLDPAKSITEINQTENGNN